ncbi:UNVERIFIED_CONTAM: protein FIZZY-RELATED 2 [Sesamum angustifolium]|uniref:Protein FIZZY-RELATED 2 n=1 Tax=Sesamum angustifolium TaxID=2727405 RepID=A0AAW2IK30_9LAMI
MEGHRLRVGALAWSSSVLSSGSRDKSILQRDIRAQEDYVSKLSGHKSEWSYDNRLASGWNDNRVCNLVWSKNVNELVSTHGYSQNQIIVWRYPTMSKLATLTGHTYRVLYLAISPDGQTIVTGAGDETLRFWNVFPSPKSQNTESEIGASSLGRTQIR